MSWAKKQAGRHSWRSWGIIRKQRAADNDFVSEAVAADQQWFWTDRWQKMEREVDEHIARGEVKTFDNAQSFIASLSESSAEQTMQVRDGDWLCRCREFHAPQVERCDRCGMTREESPGTKAP